MPSESLRSAAGSLDPAIADLHFGQAAGRITDLNAPPKMVCSSRCGVATSLATKFIDGRWHLRIKKHPQRQIRNSHKSFEGGRHRTYNESLGVKEAEKQLRAV